MRAVMPLQHHRRGLVEADSGRQADKAVGVDQPRFGIAADRAGISDAVADGDSR